MIYDMIYDMIQIALNGDEIYNFAALQTALHD